MLKRLVDLSETATCGCRPHHAPNAVQCGFGDTGHLSGHRRRHNGQRADTCRMQMMQHMRVSRLWELHTMYAVLAGTPYPTRLLESAQMGCRHAPHGR